MDNDKVLKNNEAGGENLSDAEKIAVELGDFVKKAKEQEDYEEWREYNVPVELTDEVAPVLKGLEKTAVDYSFDETNSKYVDDLDGFLGVDVDEEDFYDFESGHVDDDAYSDAKHASRLQKINALGEDEHFGGYGFAEGFNLFNVKYDVDGGEGKSDETLTYTRDILSDRKSVPTSMTTGLAELLIEKLKEEGTGVETLEKMPSFEEHMAEKKEQEKIGKVGEVYGKIAKEALMKWNGLSEEEADEKIANSSFDELESMIGARGSIEAACESITKRLDVDSEKLINAVIHGEDAEVVFGKIAEKMPQDYEFVFGTLSDVHDRWIKDNEKKFFDPARQDRLYQFAPLSLIGEKEARSDLLFVGPILKACGNKNDLSDEVFDDEYMDWASDEDIYYERNAVQYDITGDVGYPIGWGLLSQLLDDPRMVLEACSDKIVTAVERDSELALRISRQILAKMGASSLDLEIFDDEVAWLAEDDEDFDDGDEEEEEDDDGNDDPYFTSQEYINDGWD